MGSNVIAHFIASLSTVEQDIHLILDDFHHITDAEILEAIARLAQYPPARLHLVILSRHRLPATIDAIIRKKDHLEISGSDLKFSEKETKDLFRKIISLSFSRDQIRTINQHVEGWAAGLQLIGVAVKSKGLGADISHIMAQAHEKVTGYLIHDILSMQSEKVSNFVLVTALLDRFNPELCAVVAGISSGDKMLARLMKINLFLIPLDPDNKWYRYHHMFSEVIRRKVSIDNPELILTTLRKAAKWFVKNHYLEDALRSAFRSKDFEFAADLMEDNLLEYIIQCIEENDPVAGIRWMLRLPQSVLSRRGLLRLYQCGFLMLLMEFAEVKKILSDLEGIDPLAFKEYCGDKQSFYKKIQSYFNCIMQIFQAEETADAAQLKDLQQSFSHKDPLLSVGVEMLMVFIFISKGELTLAEQSLAKFSKHPAWPKNRWREVFIAKSKSLIARNRGQLHQSEAILNQMFQSLDRKKNGNIPIAHILHRPLGRIFYFQNKLEKAKEYGITAAQRNEYPGLLDEVMTGYELRFQLLMASGETEQAALRIQQIKDFSVKLDKPTVVRSAEVSAARLAIERQPGCRRKLGPTKKS